MSGPTQIDAEKAEARRAAFAARKTAFAEGQGAAADHLTRALLPHGGKVLAGYMPMRTEIDPLPAMARHCTTGRVGVPVILGPGQALSFREWTPDAPMVEGDFKALIPQDGAWLVPEVVIVPLVGFDAKGYRLGYGGGFYDRTLSGLRQRGKVLAIGFAFAQQELPHVPIDAYDQRLDAIVTQDGIRWFG